MKTNSVFTLPGAWLLTATLLAASFARAVIPPLTPMKLTVSGPDILLSFSTTTTNYYGLQMRPDFSQPWTNIQAGIPGNGAVQSATLAGAVSSGQGFYRLVLQPQPVSLILPQGDAFAILGHSCGGIQEQVYSTGFDPTNGYPVGVVYLKTSCGGSGRGGGYTTTTYTAWAAATWDFAGNVIAYSATSNAAGSSPFITTDVYGDILYNNGGLAFLVVPFAAAPTDVNAVLSNDQFLVSWTPNGINPLAVTSSTLTATPVNSPASVLMATVTGSATNGAIPQLQPATTYQITVVNNALSGPSPASDPITLTTPAASVPPSAPTNVAAHWVNLDPPGTTDTLVATWNAANPGDSPIDQYQVTITPSGGGSVLTNLVSGTTLTTSFIVDFGPDWTVRVNAHNSVGWGPTSTPVTLGGL